MKKRFLSLLLTLLVLLTALPPAASAAAAKPKAPAWVDANEYIVFEGDPVYEQATWSKILKLRADAAKGNPAPKEGSALYAAWKSGENYATGTPGLRYELALIGMKYGQNAENGGILHRRANISAMLREWCWTSAPAITIPCTSCWSCGICGRLCWPRQTAPPPPGN